jgi:3-hydroxybutyryl-CoA dehydratase
VIMWSRGAPSGWETLVRASLAPSLAWRRILIGTYRSLMMPLAEPRRPIARKLAAPAPVRTSSPSQPSKEKSVHHGTGMYAGMNDEELAEVVAFHEAQGAYHAAWHALDALDTSESEAHSLPGSIHASIHARVRKTIVWREDLPAVGQSATTTRVFRREDVAQFAHLSGDRNPLHLEPEAWVGTPFTGNLVHGALTASLFSQLMGMEVPGPGGVYLGQTLKFQAPVYIGETVTATVTVTQVRTDKRIIMLETRAEVTRDGLQITVLEGEAVAKLLTRRDPKEDGV